MRKALSALLSFYGRSIDRARQTAAAFLVGLGIGSFLVGPAALALVFPGQYAPRYFPTQQTHYERHLINITSTACTADTAQNTALFSAGSCSIRIGALPYNAFVVRAALQITTACNAATTCTVALGTASGGAQLLAAQSILAAAGTAVLTPAVAATAGILSTGNNTTASGANGGFDLFATIAQTGAAATAGTVVVILEYFGPNDGGCLPNVPMASTAGPC
jgi:hypothetical protein